MNADPAVPVLPEHVAADLFQIAREAVTNAVRHGESTDVEIRLSRNEEGITLAVVDDGIGFADGGVAGEGVGLRIMLYRSQRIGASLEVSSPAVGGAVVECLVPVAPSVGGAAVDHDPGSLPS